MTGAPTEDDYYATLDDNLQYGTGGEATGAYDLVCDLESYRLFRRALVRWMEDRDREWDEQAAANDEHEVL